MQADVSALWCCKASCYIYRCSWVDIARTGDDPVIVIAVGEGCFTAVIADGGIIELAEFSADECSVGPSVGSVDASCAGFCGVINRVFWFVDLDGTGFRAFSIWRGHGDFDFSIFIRCAFSEWSSIKSEGCAERVGLIVDGYGRFTVCRKGTDKIWSFKFGLTV